jgi:hypothetical protein
MFAPEHMRAARAAMLQAALAAFFMDVQDDGCDEIQIVMRAHEGDLVICATQLRLGMEVMEWVL